MDAHRQDPGTGYDENSSVCPLVKAPSVLEGGSEKNDVVVEAPPCAFSGCTSKAMPLTMYCYQHILFDSRQTLYKPCSYKTSRCGVSLPFRFLFFLCSLWNFVMNVSFNHVHGAIDVEYMLLLYEQRA